MTDNIALMDVGDSAEVTIRWNGLGTATITSVTYSVPAPLTHTSAGINNALSPPITNVMVSGAEHGQTYMCEAQVVLSTGETLNRQFVIKGFNN
jgi:hypothetical protein